MPMDSFYRLLANRLQSADWRTQTVRRSAKTIHCQQRRARADSPTGGLSLYAVTPCRVVDTRKPAGSPAITSLDVGVSASACGIPANAQAHVFGVTVVPAASLGYLTLWPQGQARPVVATLNALDGAITSNLAIVPTTNGSISAFASDLTHVILDISGYFGQ
jgi:hypothetical protein